MGLQFTTTSPELNMTMILQKWVNRYTWASACCITACLFLLFTIIATPLLNSGDDTFLMYTLGGGYGEAPTDLAHYNYGWNFLLGGFAKRLFILLPGMNWYTVILLLFHSAGSAAFLYVLLKRNTLFTALLLFLIPFFFFEARQLLSLTYSGASLVAGAGASVLLIYQLGLKKIFNGNTFLAVLLLLLAGMLRLQIVWLVALLFASVAITLLNKQQLLRWGLTMLLVIGALWGLNKLHERYYSKNIPGWEQQEKFRQALFYSYNRQLVRELPAGTFKDSTEQELFFAGFLYDSVRFNAERVTAIGKQITRNRSLDNKDDCNGLYWFFIEMRVYILLFIVVLVSLFVQRKYLPVRKWLLAFLAALLIHSYLFIFLKITMAIHLGILFFLWMALAMQFTKEDRLFTGNKKFVVPLVLVLVLLFGWMGIRVWKENNGNKERYQRFLCAMGELNSHPDKLFVATDDAFPLNFFYIWNTPRQYPAANLLYKDRLITHTYLQTLKRFDITNLEDALVNNKKVLLPGKALPALEKGKQAATLSAPLPGFQCLKVRQLNRVQ
jgi:hypothetical protein